jgi:hypothetical protein
MATPLTAFWSAGRNGEVTTERPADERRRHEQSRFLHAEMACHVYRGMAQPSVSRHGPQPKLHDKSLQICDGDHCGAGSRVTYLTLHKT